MNVQPGDLAMVVRNTTGDGCMAYMIGTPVKIVARGTPVDNEGPWWTYAGPLLHCHGCGKTTFMGFLDADLQRLRGPELKAKSHDALLDRVLHGVPA